MIREDTGTLRSLDALLRDVEDDGIGTIEYEEFLELMTQKMTRSRQINKMIKSF